MKASQMVAMENARDGQIKPSNWRSDLKGCTLPTAPTV